MKDLKLEFFFRGGPVGIFQTTEYPREPGVYPYMPYRSGAHYSMGQTRLVFGFAECTYPAPAGTIRFKVLGWPEYGRLELTDFVSDEIGAE